MNNLIFILDLDGTIIGDCKYQCEIYNIEKILKKNSVKCNFSNTLKKSYNQKSKLLRPYFIHFFNSIKKKYPSALIYVYTSSEKNWANKQIIMIEKENNIKFNRPIFTRNDCILGSDGTYKKSINNILKKKINNSEIIIIDNNNVYIDNTDKLLICPTYKYILFHDMWELIPENINKNINIYLEKLIKNNYLCPYNTNSFSNMKIKCKIYKWLYNKCITNNTKDFFWKNITDFIIKNDINKNFMKLCKDYLNL